MKACRSCGEVKSATDFNQRRGKCKSCQSNYRRAYGEARRDALNANAAEYREANRDLLAEKSRERYWSMTPDGRRESNRAYGLRHLYGMSLEEYDALLEKQGGGCALCGRGPGRRALCVDHDHETGAIRGILCGRCNTALGTLGDNADGLRRALDYIQRGGV